MMGTRNCMYLCTWKVIVQPSECSLSRPLSVHDVALSCFMSWRMHCIMQNSLTEKNAFAFQWQFVSGLGIMRCCWRFLGLLHQTPVNRKKQMLKATTEQIEPLSTPHITTNLASSDVVTIPPAHWATRVWRRAHFSITSRSSKTCNKRW